ncbi:MAG: flagellar basal body-associated FliL family protein [Planctomycetota bacterium]
MSGEANQPEPDQDPPAAASKKPSAVLPTVLGVVAFLLLVSSAFAVATYVVPHAAGAGKKTPAADAAAKEHAAEPAAEHHEEAKHEEGGHGADDHADADRKPGDGYRYLVPSAVVNLSGDKLLRFAKVSIVLDCATTKTKAEIEPAFERHKVDIQDCLIAVIGAKTVDDIAEPYGKMRLKEEIRKAMNKIVFGGDKGPDRVEQVYFSEFLVQ